MSNLWNPILRSVHDGFDPPRPHPLGIGLVAALAAGRLLAGALFGVSPGDPLVLGSVLVTLLAVAATAGLVPIRAARVDPAEALRAG